jgi:hypothetical protein
MFSPFANLPNSVMNSLLLGSNIFSLLKSLQFHQYSAIALQFIKDAVMPSKTPHAIAKQLHTIKIAPSRFKGSD